MKNSSKLALSQSLVAVPAAFSATTYNINETLSFSDYAGSDDAFITALLFDVDTGNIQKVVDSESSSSMVDPSMDVAISLFRSSSPSGTYSNASGKSEGGKGSFKALTTKSTSSDAKGMPINPDWAPFGDELKASPSTTLYPSYGTFFGYAGPSNDAVDFFNSLSSVASSGTHYIGFTSDPFSPGIVELYAELSFTYTGATSFADSVLVEKFVVGDPGENLLNYTLVPENKHSAAMLALLAGSAAVFSKRRKAS